MKLNEVLETKNTLEEKVLAILDFHEEYIDGRETLGIHCINYNKIAKKIIELCSDSLHNYFNSSSDANVYLEASKQEELEKQYKNFILDSFEKTICGWEKNI